MSEDSGVEHRVDVGIELVLSLEVDFIDWTAPLEDPTKVMCYHKRSLKLTLS